MKKVFLALFLMISFTALYSLEATVTAVSGKVEYLVDGNWVQLQVGSKLAKGDTVQTGFKSELTLQIGTATVNLSPLSRVTIEQLAEKKAEDGSPKDTTSLYIDSGSVHSSIKKPADNRKIGYTVRSPVATASVRGTEFIFANRYRKSETRTLEGSVAVWKTRIKEVQIAPDEEEVVEETTEETSDETTGETTTETVAEEATEEVQEETVAETSPETSDTTTEVADVPEPPAPEPLPKITNPADITTEAPRDAFLVTKGQESSIEDSGKKTTPKEKAEEKAKELQAVVQSAVEEQTPVEPVVETPVKRPGELIIRPIFK